MLVLTRKVGEEIVIGDRIRVKVLSIRGNQIRLVETLLHRGVDGHGAVVTLVGSPGIGKSRMVREVTAMATARGVEVFSAYCESHATDFPFHAVSRMLRAVTEVKGLDQHAADRSRPVRRAASRPSSTWSLRRDSCA